MSIQMYPTCFTFSCCDILADDNKTRCCPKMARNTTGPPAIIRLEAAWRHGLACAGEAASSLIIARHGVLQTTTTDAREQNNTCPPSLCVSGPLIRKFVTMKLEIKDSVTLAWLMMVRFLHRIFCSAYKAIVTKSFGFFPLSLC